MAIDKRHQDNRMPAAALVFGIIGVPAALLPFGVPIAILAVVTGFGARRRSQGRSQSRRMANAAIALGLLGVGLWVAVILGFVLFAGVFGS
jgi:hypothetical protein